IILDRKLCTFTNHCNHSICISTSVHTISPSSAPPSDIAVAPPSDSVPEPVLGSVFEFNEGLLHPFMGLLPVERPDDPWRRKPYDPHRPLYSGGGSYAAYLKDGRRRRDTHIMGQATPGLLTPGMLERLLRIKMEFQRRFPHLYQGMLSHHANQTRVEVKPPVLGRASSPESLTKKIAPKEEEPIFELGAAERNLFEDEESDPLEDDPVQELENENEKEEKEEEQEKERDDNDIDYFNFGNDGDDY
ncbi:uncharacterized protein Dana_GF28081, partial [Drosophila ananassae]